jgi:hemoglobin
LVSERREPTSTVPNVSADGRKSRNARTLLSDQELVDLRLNANPRVDEAHHRVPPAGFKYLVTEMVCWATGGPQKYTGRSMKESHKDLMITAAEWEAFLDDLQQTLDKFAVPQTEQAEIKAIVGSTRPDIVV